MTKKVLLIRPAARDCLDFGGGLDKHYERHELELGLLYIASYLATKGIEVLFLDMSLYNDSQQRLIDALRKRNFDFIGLTAYSTFINAADRVAGIIKAHSKAKIVIGGAHASALPVATLEVFKNFDYRGLW